MLVFNGSVGCLPIKRVSKRKNKGKYCVLFPLTFETFLYETN